MYVRMKVDGVMLDPGSKSPVVLLKEAEGERSLPIWIGIFEAASILFALEGVPPPRPLTHDLMKTVIETLGASVTRVDVDALEDGVFLAKVHLATAEGTRLVDCRPSDGLAVAVRADAPVFAEEEVIREAGVVTAPATGAAGADVDWKEYLEALDPSAFGKYKM